MIHGITSISPSHKAGDIQGDCVRSWMAHGIKAHTLNLPLESIEVPKGCIRIDANRDARHIHGKPYAFISEMVEVARANDWPCLMIINSDIALHDPNKVLPGYIEQAERGLVVSQRWDHNGDLQNLTQFTSGWDVFIIHRKFYGIVGESLFVMGQTWWDYWLPYRFIQSKVPLLSVKEPIFTHQRHPIQYSNASWERMTRLFQWHEQYMERNNSRMVSNSVHQLILRHAR